VQAAKILGAARVVGVGRDADRLRRAQELGADAVVELDGGDLEARLAESFAGAPPTVVFDTLWGRPVEAAAAVVGPGARVAHVGQSAGPTATLGSAHVRGKQLQILGYSNFTVPYDALAQGYRDLLGHVAGGKIDLDVEAFTLDRITEAWARQQQGPGAKLVVVP
jgi:NADPH2:quinone reductase